MGRRQNRFIPTLIALSAVAMVSLPGQAAPDLNGVRKQINVLETELLQTNETQMSAANQLKKIRKLLSLQKQEIAMSKAKVQELSSSLKELSVQKDVVLTKIEKQKAGLKKKLRDLNRLTEGDALDASWLQAIDETNQKSYFLSKTLKRDLAQVEQFKRDVTEAQALELRILEEKNKVDYYVQELHTQNALLSANEEIQKEIIETNRASRLEVLHRMRALKESERELEQMIANLRDSHPVAANPAREEIAASGTVDVTLAALKGKLPVPVDGPLLSGFGKSYNPKTNLLTFQKGITLAARPASEVKSVAAGKVVFAGPLNNYGLIVIVEHPGQYYTLYGHMGGVAVENGTEIEQGEVVGRTTGEPFYFEIRNKNVAINPLQWLGNGSITLSRH